MPTFNTHAINFMMHDMTVHVGKSKKETLRQEIQGKSLEIRRLAKEGQPKHQE